MWPCTYLLPSHNASTPPTPPSPPARQRQHPPRHAAAAENQREAQRRQRRGTRSYTATPPFPLAPCGKEPRCMRARRGESSRVRTGWGVRGRWCRRPGAQKHATHGQVSLNNVPVATARIKRRHCEECCAPGLRLSMFGSSHSPMQKPISTPLRARAAQPGGRGRIPDWNSGSRSAPAFCSAANRRRIRRWV